MNPQKEAMMFELIGRHAFENAVLKSEVMRLQEQIKSAKIDTVSNAETTAKE